MKQRFSLLVALLFAACGVGLAQSLAEVARQTREDDKKPVKVFTDADMPSRSSSTSSTLPAVHGGTSVAGGKTTDSKTASAPAKTEKEVKQSDSSPAKGKDAAAAMKKELDHYTEQRDAWKNSAQRYQDLLQNETSEFRRQTYREALDVDQHNVELYQQKIDDVQSQMAKAQQASGSSSQGSEDQSGAGGHR